MKRNKIVIVKDCYWDFWIIMDPLEKLLGDYADIECLDIDDINSMTSADLILTMCTSSYSKAVHATNNNIKVISVLPSLFPEAANTIESLPAHTVLEIYTKSDEMYFSMQRICVAINFNDITFERGFSNSVCKRIGETQIAIIANHNNTQTQIIVEKFYLSLRTIVNIIVELELFYHVDNTKLHDYYKNISMHKDFFTIYKKAEEVKSRVITMTIPMRRSVVEVDADLRIQFLNNVAEKLFKTTQKQAIGVCVDNFFPDLTDVKTLRQNIPTKDKRVVYMGNRYFVSSYPVIDDHNEFLGAHIIIEGVSDTEDIYKNVRGQMSKQGHLAHYTINHIIGESEAIKNLKNIITRMAISDSSVLITGETGTGKEIIAQSIHNLSTRKDKPFVAINCVALPENLLESELFGYEEGAFTGARKGGKKGVFEIADGGTVFLDEIGKMPMSLQGKLLRVIQEREIMPLGSDKIYKINIRLISSTNRDAMELINEGLFMSDLYYRISALPISVPPLRERRSDIIKLMEHFKKDIDYPFEFSDEALSAILSHTWNGNVRELTNTIEYLAHLRKPIIDLDDLPRTVVAQFSLSNNLSQVEIPECFENDDSFKATCKILLECYFRKIRIGRAKIATKINDMGLFATEQQVRRYLEYLRHNNFLADEKGGAGTRLNNLGKEQLKSWLNW